MNGDVRVFGLVVGQHVLEDISIGIPHGREVVIPGDLAQRSKDLWRAISQKRIFQLPSQPAPQYTAPVTHIRDDVLQERNGFLEAKCKQLESENQRLQDENQRLQEGLRLAATQQSGAQLETILKAIQDIKLVSPVYVSGSPVHTPIREEVADGSAPSFIPSEIAPKGADTRIVVQRGTGDGGVSDAADKLRKLRRGVPG